MRIAGDGRLCNRTLLQRATGRLLRFSDPPIGLGEMRAATSLARLWRDQGNRDEARELLAPI
jgi:hypothetical protein